MTTQENDPTDRHLLLWLALSLCLHLVAAGLLYVSHDFGVGTEDKLEVEWVTLASEPLAPSPVPEASEPTSPPSAAVAPAPAPLAQTQLEPPKATDRLAKVETQTTRAESVPPETQIAITKENGEHNPLGLDTLLPSGSWSPGTGTGADNSGAPGRGEPGGVEGGWATGRGTGLVPLPVVKERIQEDARRAVAENRVARGLVSPEMNSISTKLEDNWPVTLEEVHRWPIRPEVKVEYWTPEGTEGDVAVPSCTYRRFSLAVVQVVVDRDGVLVSTNIVRSSGSRRLNREAIDLITRSSPFPAPEPDDLDASGHSSSTWDVGVRDYTISSCFYLGRKKLVKDIVLLGAY